MPWNKDSDSAATYPLLMRVAALPGAQSDDVNLIAGFVWRLSLLSSMHLQDYMIDAGTVAMVGGSSTDRLVRIACKVKLLTKCRVDGFVSYKIVDDPDFINMRLRAEIEWDRQQRADRTNTQLTAKVRHRDGDNCRYCGVMVMWTGRPGARAGTYDHLEPGTAATFSTLVVACLRCNSQWRDIHGDDRADDLRPAPPVPFYKPATATFLNQNGYNNVQPTAKPKKKSKIKKNEGRPDRQPDTAKTKNHTAPRQRPDSQSDTASSTSPGVSDPAPAGPRAPGDDASGRPPPASTETGVSQDFGTSSAGSGRVGSGSASGSVSERSVTRTRKRSRRGAGRDQERD